MTGKPTYEELEQRVEELLVSKNMATALLEVIPDLVFRLNKHGVYLDFQAKKSLLFTQSSDDVIGNNNHDIFPKKQADQFNRLINITLDTGNMQTIEYQLPMPDRGLVDFEARMVKCGKDEVITIVRDVTHSKLAEKQIRDSLNEKEVLLREIHHRVKNNMQVIVSLLRMHSRRIDDKRLGRAFDDCRDRVNAMALIHEALYQAEDLSKINFEVYLRMLCRNLGRAHNASGKGIEVTVERCNVALSMDQGIAVGMVISELISNAFKHAFPGEQGGNVSLSLSGSDEEHVRITVQDNGIGLSPEIDIWHTSSLGLRMVVATISRELGGNIEVERDNGTRYIIQFKCKKQL